MTERFTIQSEISEEMENRFNLHTTTVSGNFKYRCMERLDKETDDELQYLYDHRTELVDAYDDLLTDDESRMTDVEISRVSKALSKV